MTPEHQPQHGESVSDTTIESSVGPHRIAWISRWLNRLSGKQIFLDERPYLTRYYLIGDGSGRSFELYLHHIQLKDPYRWLHNHPWNWFFSVVLQGSYTQQVIRSSSTAGRKKVQVRFFNLFRGKTKYHAITDVPASGVWTLVLVPPKSRGPVRWGYWNEDKKEHEPDTGKESTNCRTVRFGSRQTFN